MRGRGFRILPSAAMKKSAITGLSIPPSEVPERRPPSRFAHERENLTVYTFSVRREGPTALISPSANFQPFASA